MTKTILTKSGLIVRNEKDNALFTYSPYTALFYAAPAHESKKIIQWLNKSGECPNSSYQTTLGAGWDIDHTEAKHLVPHLLPDKSYWKISLPRPEKPLLINWLITGRCPLKCQYCYAEDLMRNESLEPSAPQIERISKNILSYQPLAVVITGGDPLSSPFWARAVELLHNKTGIILDTSAYALDNNKIDVLKKYNVSVRISIDSELPQINDALRPIYGNKHLSGLNNITRALIQCLEADINLVIQTVITKRNYSDLSSFGDKLAKLGVRGWRLLNLTQTSLNGKNYKNLVSNKKRLNQFIYPELKRKAMTDWRGKMSLQIIQNKVSNSVILVSPDGKFMTESAINEGKFNIDEKSILKPKLSSIFKAVSVEEHAKRYLNYFSEE